MSFSQATRFFVVAGLTALLALGLPYLSKASDADPSERDVKRLRVGLVLSGGGARGAAHVGVLQVLEDMRIPVDVITGTSMGAIVGGLYAAGLSPADMEKIITGIAWNDAFRDKGGAEDLTFRRKEDASEYLIDFDLGIKHGKLAMPKGLLQGQRLMQILKSILLHTEGISNFDHLNIPFRAVAADIETGRPVIIQDGELVRAIRASMSIPGVFAPVESRGKILVDGGVAMNLPVEVALAMGVDVIIAVDIGTGLRTGEKLTSTVGITSQLLTILIQKNTAEQIAKLKTDDILIRPELGNISTGDFAHAHDAIVLGREKALSMQRQLARLSVDEAAYAGYLAHQRKTDTIYPIIDEVELVNHTTLPDAVIKKQIGIRLGDTLDMDRLKRSIDRIYGIDTFERVDFHLRKKDKSAALVIEPVEKSWGPTYLRFGLGLEENFKGSSTYGITVQLMKTAINRLAGEWRLEGRIGSNPRVYTEFYQPIDPSLSYFIAANAEYSVRTINQFNALGDNVAQYRISAYTGGIDVGRQFGNWGELRMGLRREHGQAKMMIGEYSGASVAYDRGSFFTAAAYSTLDNYIFPLSGSDASILWEYDLKALGSDIDIQSLGFQWLSAWTWRKLTFQPAILIRTTLDRDDAPVQDAFPLGGFLRLSGYSADELYGRYTGLMRLVMYREVFSAGLGFLNTPIYLGGSVETGNVWNLRDDIKAESLIWAGSVFVGTKTFLGPVYLAYGQSRRDRSSVYLFLGQHF